MGLLTSQISSVPTFILPNRYHPNHFVGRHFNNPNEVLQFLHDVDGKIIRNVPLQVSQCELRQEQDPRISGWHKQPKSLQEEQRKTRFSFFPFVTAFLDFIFSLSSTCGTISTQRFFIVALSSGLETKVRLVDLLRHSFFNTTNSTVDGLDIVIM